MQDSFSIFSVLQTVDGMSGHYCTGAVDALSLIFLLQILLQVVLYGSVQSGIQNMFLLTCMQGCDFPFKFKDMHQKVQNSCIPLIYRMYLTKPSPACSPYLLSYLLYHTLQCGGHSLSVLPLLQQLSVHLVLQPLRRGSLHSAGQRPKTALIRTECLFHITK